MAKNISKRIKFVDQEYDWKSLSLWEFLNEGNIPSGWTEFFLRSDVQKDLWQISEFLKEEAKRKTIYPEINKVFRAFIPLDDNVKMVMIAQDPYANGSAIGLCYSVVPGNKINPSLLNIYEELKQSGYKPKRDGVLIHWAKQGVIMLNTALTVRKGDSESHLAEWYEFTEKVIAYIAQKTSHVVWLLTGAKALAFSNLIQGDHQIIVTSHPSPLSATRGFRGYPAFIGSGLFWEANEYLKSVGKKEIKW